MRPAVERSRTPRGMWRVLRRTRRRTCFSSASSPPRRSLTMRIMVSNGGRSVPRSASFASRRVCPHLRHRPPPYSSSTFNSFACLLIVSNVANQVSASRIARFPPFAASGKNRPTLLRTRSRSGAASAYSSGASATAAAAGSTSKRATAGAAGPAAASTPPAATPSARGSSIGTDTESSVSSGAQLWSTPVHCNRYRFAGSRFRLQCTGVLHSCAPLDLCLFQWSCPVPKGWRRVV